MWEAVELNWCKKDVALIEKGDTKFLFRRGASVIWHSSKFNAGCITGCITTNRDCLHQS